MKKILMLTLLMSSFFVTGCHKKKAQHILDLVNKFGPKLFICTSSKGCGSPSSDEYFFKNFRVVDHHTHGKNRVVLQVAAPNHSTKETLTSVYIAVDMTNYDKLLDDIADGDPEDALEDFFEKNFEKFGFVHYEASEDHFIYENKDGEWNLLSESATAVKDLELIGSKVEDQKANIIGEDLAAQFGLSEERAYHVAKTMAAYNRLISKRALTAREKNQFSKTLLGVDYKVAEDSIMSGDEYEYNALMEKAAEFNETTPEQVSAIIKEFIL